jgi:hypothetical protein
MVNAEKNLSGGEARAPSETFVSRGKVALRGIACADFVASL